MLNLGAQRHSSASLFAVPLPPRWAAAAHSGQRAGSSKVGAATPGKHRVFSTRKTWLSASAAGVFSADTHKGSISSAFDARCVMPRYQISHRLQRRADENRPYCQRAAPFEQTGLVTLMTSASCSQCPPQRVKRRGQLGQLLRPRRPWSVRYCSERRWRSKVARRVNAEVGHH
jgi:hypothetical protein